MSTDIYTPENIELLTKLHQLARFTAVGYSTVYEEASDTWYVTLNSSATTENFVGKSRGYLEHALQDAIDFLETTR